MDDKYLAFQAKLEADREHQALQQANLCAKVQFRKLMQKLETEQQDVIYEYLGTLAELQMREIELALMHNHS